MIRALALLCCFAGPATVSAQDGPGSLREPMCLALWSNTLPQLAEGILETTEYSGCNPDPDAFGTWVIVNQCTGWRLYADGGPRAIADMFALREEIIQSWDTAGAMSLERMKNDLEARGFGVLTRPFEPNSRPESCGPMLPDPLRDAVLAGERPSPGMSVARPPTRSESQFR